MKKSKTEKEEIKDMSKKEKSFYPTGIHGIRRGDIYYVDFGKIEDVVGCEAAK